MTKPPLLPGGARLGAVVFDFDGTLARPELDFGVMRRAVSEAVVPFMPQAEPRPDLPVMEWLQTVHDALAATAPQKADRAFAAGHDAIRAVEVEAYLCKASKGQSGTSTLPLELPTSEQIWRSPLGSHIPELYS